MLYFLIGGAAARNTRSDNGSDDGGRDTYTSDCGELLLDYDAVERM